ncbi:MAG: YciI family protein [Gammaproteobacteria bacterium]
MPKYVTIGYGDREGYVRTSIDVRNAAHAHDAELQKRGVLMGIAGEPVQVRNPDAMKVDVASGPFMSSALPIAGFAIIEAADISEAIAIVSKVPCAVAHGVVEVWPLNLPD